MLITAHQHLDTHKQNQSGTRSQPKTFSYYKKTNKQDCNMIKHTEHFPSNLQASAHKKSHLILQSRRKDTNKHLTPARVFFMSSEMYTSLFSVLPFHITSSVRYQYVQHAQIFTHCKKPAERRLSISYSKRMNVGALALGLYSLTLQFLYFQEIWKSHLAIQVPFQTKSPPKIPLNLNSFLAF